VGVWCLVPGAWWGHSASAGVGLEGAGRLRGMKRVARPYWFRRGRGGWASGALS